MKRKQAYKANVYLVEPGKVCLLLTFLFLSMIPPANAQDTSDSENYTIRGRVLSADDNQPLPAATVQFGDESEGVIADKKGAFTVTSAHDKIVIKVLYVGYQEMDTTLVLPLKHPLIIKLEKDATMLGEVVVSTGYETIPKARATGSFVLIDSALLNRRVGTNLLSRLEGVTSGLVFNHNLPGPANNADISIRGRSTIFANPDPLIILDNFPYTGNLDNINPNDVENITVLKDAAAASIWGVRAGNGVIVITTKKGTADTSPQVSFNSNVTVGKRPDLYYERQLTAAEFIDLEQFLFNNGRYNSIINGGYAALTPAVEVFLQRRNREISAADSASIINQLKAQDVRDDIARHIYRESVNQQYAVSVKGGGRGIRYYVSAGYDKNLNTVKVDSYDRFTLSANNSYSFLDGKLDWTNGIIFSNTRRINNTSVYTNPFTPYDRLAGEDGNPLAVYNDFRRSYLDTAGAGLLLDWRYFPLKDMDVDKRIAVTTDYRINTALHYQIWDAFKLSAYYMYQRGGTKADRHRRLDSYYTRDQINSFSQIDYVTGEVIRPIPIGGIMEKSNADYTIHTGRVQVSYNQDLGSEHEIAGIAGFEISENRGFINSYRLYGYDSETATNANQTINFFDDFPYFYGTRRSRIPSGTTGHGTVGRNRSYYINASYSFNRRYVISGSARRDESNLFGVRSNQKGVPLWSAGFSWIINREPFYDLEWIPSLKIRLTYGYSGNMDNSTTAYLTADRSGSVNWFNAPFQRLSNPPNPSLRWERVGVVNLGIDFVLKQHILSGSLEYYHRKSTDLIAVTPVAPQTGFTEFRGNAASMETRGVDFVLNVKPFSKAVQWNAALLFNYKTDKITDYLVGSGANRDVVTSNYINPLEGYPYYAVFSFPYAGLDGAGNPRGYLNGEISDDYRSILGSKDPANLIYHGSASPSFFGSIMNSFRYRQMELSINIVYKMGHYFRRRSLNYVALFNGTYQQGDYNKRWQQPGDEDRTTVPAMIYPADINRRNFYVNSETLIEKADCIRLQDIRFSYTFRNSNHRELPFRSLQVYVYANNLAMLWRANELNLDPDVPNSGAPVPRSIALGIRANL